MDKVIEIILSKKVIVPFFIVIFATIIYLILSKIIHKLLSVKLKGVRINDRRQKTTVSLIDNIIKYFIAIISLLMILDVFGIDTKSLVTSLGVVSLVAGLALQDFLKDIIAGVSILFEDQYAVGDVVTIGDFKGTVIYLGIKSTRVKAFNGETLVISNRNIDKVINHSLEDSVSFLDVQISYDEDIDKAKNVLTELCEKLTKELSLVSDAKVCGVQDLADSSVVIRLSFTCAFSEKAKNERLFKERIKKEFDINNIEIPFTQVVIHNGK